MTGLIPISWRRRSGISRGVIEEAVPSARKVLHRAGGRMTGSASAPGSSGNLGPGFDVLGLALDLRCRVTASPSSDMTVDDGEGPEPLADDHIIHRSVNAATDAPMAIVVDNSVPRTRGLGSSAAVMAAAAAASVRASGGEADQQAIYDIVAGDRGPWRQRRPSGVRRAYCRRPGWPEITPYSRSACHGFRSTEGPSGNL